jgi:dihydrofolate reductase
VARQRDDAVADAIERALAAAGEKDVHVMGGGETIRGALAAGLIDELTIILAPLILGAGKRLFEGFDQDVELRQLSVRQSDFATFVEYAVKR